MFHRQEIAVNESTGVPISGVIIRLYTSDDAAVPLYSDQNGTPIVSVSGIDNAAVSDEAGNYSYYVPNGVYTERLYVGDVEAYSVPDLVCQGIVTTIQTPILADAGKILTSSETNLVILAGTNTNGDEGTGRQFIYDEEVDPDYVAANPSNSFIDSTGRGFKEVPGIQTAAASAATAVSASSSAGIYAAAASTAASNATEAAALAKFYPGARSYVPQGLTAVAITAAGSGGTNGTYTAPLTGDNLTVDAYVTVTVSGGAVTAASVAAPGLYIGASLTIGSVDLSGITGLTGATVTATGGYLVTSGQYYTTDHATDAGQVALFQNQANAAVQVLATIDWLPNSVAVAAANDARDASFGPAIDAFDHAANFGRETIRDAVDFVNASVEIDFPNDYYRDRRKLRSTASDLAILTAVQPATTWAPNADGTLTKFAPNTPRVTDLGLRIGAGTTNLVTSPDDLNSWTKNAVATVTTGQLAPDGTNTAFRINDANAGGLASISQATTVAISAVNYTWSVYIKKEASGAPQATIRCTFTGGTTRTYDVQFYPDTGGATGTSLTATTVTPLKDTAGNDWWRVEGMHVAPETHTGIVMQIYPASAAAANTGSITCWMPQAELGSSATTPVVGTRAADQVTLALFAGAADDVVTATLTSGGSAAKARSQLASSSAVVLAPSGGDIAVNGTVSTIRAVTAEAELGRTVTKLKTLAAAGGQPAVMASGSPTITAGTAATLTGSLVAWNTPDKFGLMGGDWQVSGAVYPDTLLGRPRSVRYSADGTSYAATDPYVEFIHTGDAFEINLKAYSGGAYRLFVDGKLSANAIPALTTIGGLYYVKIDFGSAATRRIRLELTAGTLAFGGVQVKTGQSVSAPPAYPLRLVVLGDSFTEGTGATNAATGFAPMLAHELGVEDYRISGSGGTGWDQENVSLSRIDYRDRWAYDMIAAAPDVAVVVGSINDGPKDPATVAARMLASVQDLRAARPGCLIHVFGPQDVSAPSAPLAGVVTLDTAMQAALEGAGIEGAWYHSLLGVAFTKIGDGVHPDQAGHAAFKNAIYGAIAAVHGLRAL
jgi:lysophospholipase L1-like esterase